MKGQFERSFKTFNWLRAFESFTGGGGDADLCDDSNAEQAQIDGYELRLKGARADGLDVGGLTPKTINEWHELGWYELFNNR